MRVKCIAGFTGTSFTRQLGNRFRIPKKIWLGEVQGGTRSFDISEIAEPGEEFASEFGERLTLPTGDDQEMGRAPKQAWFVFDRTQVTE